MIFLLLAHSFSDEVELCYSDNQTKCYEGSTFIESEYFDILENYISNLTTKVTISSHISMENGRSIGFTALNQSIDVYISGINKDILINMDITESSQNFIGSLNLESSLFDFVGTNQISIPSIVFLSGGNIVTNSSVSFIEGKSVVYISPDSYSSFSLKNIPNSFLLLSNPTTIDYRGNGWFFNTTDKSSFINDVENNLVVRQPLVIKRTDVPSPLRVTKIDPFADRLFLIISGSFQPNETAIEFTDIGDVSITTSSPNIPLVFKGERNTIVCQNATADILNHYEFPPQNINNALINGYAIPDTSRLSFPLLNLTGNSVFNNLASVNSIFLNENASVSLKGLTVNNSIFLLMNSSASFYDAKLDKCELNIYISPGSKTVANFYEFVSFTEPSKINVHYNPVEILKNLTTVFFMNCSLSRSHNLSSKFIAVSSDSSYDDKIKTKIEVNENNATITFIIQNEGGGSSNKWMIVLYVSIIVVIIAIIAICIFIFYKRNSCNKINQSAQEKLFDSQEYTKR